MEHSADNLLDSVDWKALSHAYGQASDVPALLRQLRDPNSSQREKAYNALWGNIFHQGTRYSATAHAVPYLLELLRDPSTPDRNSLINYVLHLALGYQVCHMPGGVNVASLRQKKDGFPTFYDKGSETLATYEAVQAGVPIFQGLLAAEDVSLRISGAFALAWFPEATGSVTLLQELLDKEQNACLVATAIVAIGLLEGSWDDTRPDGIDDLIARLRQYAGDERPLVQWAAAIALVRLQYHGPEDVAILIRSLKKPESIDTHSDAGDFLFCDGDVVKYSAIVLRAITGDYPEIATAVLDVLSRSKAGVVLHLFPVAMNLAFGRDPIDSKTTTFSDLNGLQQQTVTVLADMDANYWMFGDFSGPLQAWGLPWRSREELRRYAGL